MEFFDVIKPFYVFSKVIGLYSFTMTSSFGRLDSKITFLGVLTAIAVSFLPLVFSSLLNFDVFWVKVYPEMILINLWDNVAKFGIAFPMLQVLHHQIKS